MLINRLYDAVANFQKIGTLKRTCVYCDLQAKSLRDEYGYVICTRYS